MALSLSRKDFVTLWMSLPDELKVQILGYLLPGEQRYEHYDFTKISHMFYLPKDLLPLLSVPCIAGLAKEIFYGRNTMMIVTEMQPGYILRHPPPDGTVEASLLRLDRYRLRDLRAYRENLRLYRKLFLPPPTVTPFMRKLHLTVKELNPKAIKFLQDVASGEVGFTALRSLNISFNCRDTRRFEILALLASIPPIELPTPYLEIKFDHDYNCYTPIYQQNMGEPAMLKTWPDTLEMPLLEKLTIQAAGRVTEETWSKLLVQSKGRAEYVEAWPEMVHGYDGRRTTNKVVRLKGAQG
jgi:hypothetical protein